MAGESPTDVAIDRGEVYVLVNVHETFKGERLTDLRAKLGK